MIKAVKTGKKTTNEKYENLKKIIDEFSVSPASYNLLKDFFIK
jgi:hypothetical protein